ncbi:hypothetical protein E2542_SST09311 [Spatholobus suberectus]|nr:hypothetical protein E2542_SST09311 [Spatholobus suberectus]
MDSNNKGFYEYGLVPSNEPLKEPIKDVEQAPTTVEKGRKKKRGKLFSKKIFWIFCSDIEIESNEKIKQEQKKDGFEVKENILFSNVGTEPDKVHAAGDSMRTKTCFLVCFSNVQVTKG